jgi:hypothetical protein
MNQVAIYVSDVFAARRQDRTVVVAPPISMSITLIADGERAANVLAKAFQNQGMNIHCCKPTTNLTTVSTTWDVMAYAERQVARLDGLHQKMEEDIAAEYPPLYDPPILLDFPFIATDRHNKILFWNLPDCLTSTCHASFIITSA